MHSNALNLVQKKEEFATFSVKNQHDKTTKSRIYRVNNNCYKITDLYRQCVSSGDLDSAHCNSVVMNYVNCSSSDK